MTREKHSSDMRPDNCILVCYGPPYKYYGVQSGRECWCGSDAPPPKKKLPMSKCNMPCTGDKTKFCGGKHWMANIFPLPEDLPTPEGIIFMLHIMDH